MLWATWCRGSRDSLQELSEIQEKFKGQGVVLVGLTSEEPASVRAFLREMVPSVGFRIASDDGGKTSAEFLGFLEEPRIPHAFLVDKGSGIVWHGHPLAGLEGALKEVLSGKYDRLDLLDARDPELKYLPGARKVVASGFKASWSPEGGRLVFGQPETAPSWT